MKATAKRFWQDEDFGYHMVMGVMCLIVIVSFAVLGVAVLRGANPEVAAQAAFDKQNRRVEACIASEQYTRDECIVLMGRE